MTKVVGVIAEYNPFHRGHAYQLARAKAALGAEAAVCVMSGAFVQRGEPAAFLPGARAEAACRSGADLVLELPLAWALSSAEGFARGGIGLLRDIGVVSALSFGSESGDMAALRDTAAVLEDPALDAPVRRQLETGLSYAAARQQAAQQLCGHALPCLSRPNDTLAVEYLRACGRLGADFAVEAVPRVGGGHDEAGEWPSASALRRRLMLGGSLAGDTPPAALAVFRREQDAGRGPMAAERLEQAVLSRLRLLTPETLAELPDASEGLEHRLYAAICGAGTLEELYALAAAKRYAAARLRRMTMCAALGVRTGMAAQTPRYARVLAFNDTGRRLLREMETRCALPVITKPADGRAEPDCASGLVLEAAAWDLWSLGCTAPAERRPGAFWRSGPVYVRE